MDSVLENAETFKLRENGDISFLRFRVVKFTPSVFIYFSWGRNPYTDMPVIELQSDTVVFGRMKFNGEVRSIETISKDIGKEEAIDFWMILDKDEISIGNQIYENYELLGKFKYEELEELNFVGFSSKEETNWVVEDGEIFHHAFTFHFVF